MHLIYMCSCMHVAKSESEVKGSEMIQAYTDD